MFRVTMLPARPGDALWIEYGPEDEPFRILIDGGTSPTEPVVRQRLLDLPQERRRLELMIVTHVDTDHIGGVLRLLSDPPPGLEIGDVWFNERRHLAQPRASHLGAIDGEILGAQLDHLGLTWNDAFSTGLVVVEDGDEAPPTIGLDGGMALTLLSPDRAHTDALQTAWIKELDEAGLDPNDPDYAEKLSEKMHAKGVRLSVLGDEESETVEELASHQFVEDDSPANGSSIAVLAEHDGRSCLLTGDAVPSAMVPSIRRLLASRHQTTLAVDAVKVPHHGSTNNLNAELLELVTSPRWLFSTNGQLPYAHPNPSGVARLIVANEGRRPELGFNYPRGVNPKADLWDDADRKDELEYSTMFAPDAAGLTIDV